MLSASPPRKEKIAVGRTALSSLPRVRGEQKLRGAPPAYRGTALPLYDEDEKRECGCEDDQRRVLKRPSFVAFFERSPAYFSANGHGPNKP